MDLMSELPRPLIHHIISFLPHIDSVRTTALSRLFRSSWRSFPSIVLDQSTDEMQNMYPWYEGGEKFLNYACSCIQGREEGIKVSAFRLRANIGDARRREDHRIERLVRFAFDCCVGEVCLSFAFSSRGGKTYCPLRHAPAAPYGFTALKLSGFRLDLQDLIPNCPSLDKLCLESCDLSGDIRVAVAGHRLRILKFKYSSFEFPSTKFEIEAPKLQSFVIHRKCRTPFEDRLRISSCASLKKLKLTGVTVTEDLLINQIPKLLALETLRIRTCPGSSHVNLWSKRLRTLVLNGGDLRDIKLNAPGLEHFEVYAPKCSAISIADCKLLRSLLLWAGIRDEWLEVELPKLVALQDLSLHGCKSLERVKIRHEQLRSLNLFKCSNLKETHIHAPLLRSFKYEAGPVPFNRLSGSNSLHATLAFDRCHQTTTWFRDWKYFVGSLRGCKDLTLLCSSFNKMLSCRDNLRDISPPPLLDVKHLKVDIDSFCVYNTELVKNLLQLCPRPDILTIVSDSEEKSIKFNYEEIMLEEDDASCCRTGPSKCWKHHVKRITLENFYGKQRRLKKFFKKNAMILQTIVRTYSFAHVKT